MMDVLELLPQRRPYIMVDRLTHFDWVSAKTVFVVREDNLFCKDGVMEEAGLVENIAQTCAARTGFKQLLGNAGFSPADDVFHPSQSLEQFFDNNDFTSITESQKIKIGVIAMISMLEMKRRPLAGEVLETSMAIEEEYFSTTLIRSEVKIGDEIIATCRMKLFLTDKAPGE